MEIKDFINFTLIDIQLAIEEFNKNNSTKAKMPTEIEFELSTIIDGEDIIVASIFDKNMRDISKIKFKIEPLIYKFNDNEKSDGK